ncbi:MAG TPA: PilZ domain-containing protein [Myxococcales bacterium]|jgi:hypothetical protein
MKTLRIDRRMSRWLNVSLGGRLRAVTTDVSEFGFAAELDPVFVPGSTVDGQIQVRGKTFPFKGTVCWAKPGSKHQGLRSSIGVHFDDISQEFARTISEVFAIPVGTS